MSSSLSIKLFLYYSVQVNGHKRTLLSINLTKRCRPHIAGTVRNTTILTNVRWYFDTANIVSDIDIHLFGKNRYGILYFQPRVLTPNLIRS